MISWNISWVESKTIHAHHTNQHEEQGFMAGYSETPLAKKLGIKEGSRLGFVNTPKGFRKELGSLPAGAKIFVGHLPKPLDLIIFFTDSSHTLK